MRGRRALLVALAAATVAGVLAAGASAATAHPAEKVVVCHATSSNTNPWVQIEVSTNALPAHLGLVGNSHQHQHSLGRFDFVWTAAYDQNCTALPVTDPILVACSGSVNAPNPVQPVAADGVTLLSPITCPTNHDYVALPAGIDSIMCSEGSPAMPVRTSYQLHPNGRDYAVTCRSGEIIALRANGGRFQMICPPEGFVRLYRHALLTGAVVPQSAACTPGEIAPSPVMPVFGMTESIDWEVLTLNIGGLVQCPNGNSMSLYFLGEGGPSTSTAAFTAFPCAGGSSVDVSHLVLPA